jgi:glyoxylase-like metal-dependent hydrolase (beta-lactamase superfamily II)
VEILPGIHRIEGTFGGRYLFQHVLVGDERILLVDTGIVSTPDELIFPYLERLGHSRRDVSYVLCTHPDTDHFGGNAAVRKAAPACRVLGHKLDRRWLEDPDAMVAERYDGFRADHGVHDSDETLRALRALCGEPTALDISLGGGEWVQLGGGWRVKVLHTPGHSEGHLTVWDPRSGTLIIGDAAMGRALPFVDGSPALAATYTHPGPYLETSRALNDFGAEHLLTAHFPAMAGGEVARFFEDSREHVHTTERVLLDVIGRSDDQLRLEDLIPVVDRALGPLPAPARDTWASPLVGHLDELEASGRLVARRNAQGRKTWSPR